jgi:hypothetical protein
MDVFLATATYVSAQSSSKVYTVSVGLHVGKGEANLSLEYSLSLLFGDIFVRKSTSLKQ